MVYDSKETPFWANSRKKKPTSKKQAIGSFYEKDITKSCKYSVSIVYTPESRDTEEGREWDNDRLQ